MTAIELAARWLDEPERRSGAPGSRIVPPPPPPPANGIAARLLLHPVHWPMTPGADLTDGPEPLIHTEHLVAHRARMGPRPAGGPGLVTVVADAGLTGHGGAHVPMALKWRSAARANGLLTVVANGAESEPLSAKDATLIRQRPHLVLDGLVLAAQSLGAQRAVVWLHGSDAGTRAVVVHALSERRGVGEPGPVVEVVSGPSHYLAGESSAIAQALAGGPALPTVRRPTTPGAPRTLVHNVETLARLALLAQGVPSMGTVLLTVVGPHGRQVLEVDRGTPMVAALRAAGWPDGAASPGVLLGGFGGTWASWRDVARAAIDEPALRELGLSLGAGIIAPIPAWACPVAETAAIAKYLAAMSARQCGPCLFGLPALAESVQRLADTTAPRGERKRLAADLDAVTGRGACHHPDGATRLIGSALAVFSQHFEGHARGRACPGHRTLPVPEVD